MRLSASIYVDNQPEILYPVAWLVKRFPKEVERIYIFASDAENLNAALRDVDDPRVVSEPIGVYIRQPLDIARAQNECLRRVDRQAFDAHVIVQADIWLLPEFYSALRPIVAHRDAPPHIPTVHHVRLHASTYTTCFGATVVFPKTNPEQSQFDEASSDGAYPRGYAQLGDTLPYALDIGWHSVDAIVRHLRVHARTWSSSGSDWLLRIFDRGDRRVFIENYFGDVRKRMIANPKIMPLDGPYGEVVRSMGLLDEYALAREVLG